MKNEEEDMSNNNGTDAFKAFQWIILIVLCFAIYSIVKPYIVAIRDYGNIAPPKVTSVEETKEVETDIFTSYEVKSSTIVVKSYTDGTVLELSGNYKVDVLKDDMGYFITPIDSNGNAIDEPYSFAGQGWYNVQTKPVEKIEVEPSQNLAEPL